VGEYAKVGSNAVLLKPVPPGATAVGNPAHIVQKEANLVRTAQFARLRRDAEWRRPARKALRGLINHAVKQEQQIERAWWPHEGGGPGVSGRGRM
jgi:serine O-acetyltransferase